jgi:hypothetical protein
MTVLGSVQNPATCGRFPSPTPSAACHMCGDDELWSNSVLLDRLAKGKERRFCIDLQNSEARRRDSRSDFVRIVHDMLHNSGNRIIPATDGKQAYFLQNRGVAGTLSAE